MPATKQLFVLRHAKSSWDDPGLADHERPLAPRGRRAVKVLAEHLRTHGIEPIVVLCSTARRTRETLEGVEPGGEWLMEPELYGADASGLLERLRRVPEGTQSVMVIGHNPAMQVLVLRLTGSIADRAGDRSLADRAGDRGPTGDGSDLGEVQRKFPTGALATLTFDCAWSELAAGRARLAAFVRPKQLGGG
jgi:phosphohistidine phosphatase